MNLLEIAQRLNMEVRTGKEHLQREVTSGYASDLLSDVMAHAQDGMVWVTLQTHQNIVAVAVLKALSGIILVNAREPDEEAIQKADAHGMVILVSRLPAFEVVGRLYQMGIGGG